MTPSSTQYSCPAVTHSLFSPFFLSPLQSPPLPLMFDTVAYFPRVKEKQFLVNFPSIFSTQHASKWENLILFDTITPYHRLKGRLTAYDWSVFLLIAAPSPAGRSFIIHSAPHLHPLNHHYLAVCMCFLPLCRLSAEGGVACFLYCKLY